MSRFKLVERDPADWFKISGMTLKEYQNLENYLMYMDSGEGIWTENAGYMFTRGTFQIGTTNPQEGYALINTESCTWDFHIEMAYITDAYEEIDDDWIKGPIVVVSRRLFRDVIIPWVRNIKIWDGDDDMQMEDPYALGKVDFDLLRQTRDSIYELWIMG